MSFRQLLELFQWWQSVQWVRQTVPCWRRGDSESAVADHGSWKTEHSLYVIRSGTRSQRGNVVIFLHTGSQTCCIIDDGLRSFEFALGQTSQDDVTVVNPCQNEWRGESWQSGSWQTASNAADLSQYSKEWVDELCDERWKQYYFVWTCLSWLLGR